MYIPAELKRERIEMKEDIQLNIGRVVSAHEWVCIPNMEQYVITKDGIVGKVINESKVVPISIHETKTSKGSYLTVNITPSFKKRKQFGVHQLVAETFIKKPFNKAEVYEVNHIDGNKHNNHYTNLEWVTRRENTLHALMNGLRNDNLIVYAHDLETGERITFYSIIEVSRYFNVPRNTIKRFLSRHCVKRFLGRWKFELDFERLNLIQRLHHTGYKAWDYVACEEIKTANATDMHYLTGVHHTTIRDRVKRNNFTMISGYVFKSVHDFSDYPLFSKEEALENRNLYISKIK